MLGYNITMKISGTVKQVIYKNADNGYTVLELDSSGRGVVCTGKFPIVGTGEELELEGEYKNNPRYGQQFVASHIDIKKPTEAAAIQKYLASGLISGVGEATSRNIVNTFGEKTLEVIDCNPLELAKIRGISKRKALEIGAAYKDIKKMQDAVIFLQNYDISVSLSVKIYEAYKNKTIDIMQANPYKLIEDIDGVGFKTADRIAGKLGIEPTSEYRIRAGVLYVMSILAEQQGSTVVMLADLVGGACGVLGFGEDMLGDVEGQVTNLILEGLLKKVNYQDGEAVVTTKNYTMEKSIATKLQMLIATSEQTGTNVDGLIDHYTQVAGINLHHSQRQAIKTSAANGVSIITGGPGTGKTTIIKGLLYIFSGLGKKTMLMAPTGRAAKRLEEQTGESAATCHRALEMRYEKGRLGFARNDRNPLTCDVVIIDEVSMLDVFLTYSLLRAIPLGTKVIFVGDKDQLPSVGSGNVLADMLASEVIPITYLTQIFRQGEGSKIIENSHKINDGQMPDLAAKSNDFFYCSKYEPAAVLTEIVDMVTTRIPNFKGVSPRDIQVIAPMKSGIAGVENINLSLQNALNPAAAGKPELMVGKKLFRLGDKVMQTSNNYEQEWVKEDGGVLTHGQGVFNGDIGYIDEINAVASTMYVTFDDGRRAGYSLVEIDDLTLAYAITIHKSQGSEFKVVIIPILAGNPVLYNKNLLYTAVTRARDMVVLIGKSGNIFYMIKNVYSVQRKTLLGQFLADTGTNFGY